LSRTQALMASHCSFSERYSSTQQLSDYAGSISEPV
jgi:hypothetical protein